MPTNRNQTGKWNGMMIDWNRLKRFQKISLSKPKSFNEKNA